MQKQSERSTSFNSALKALLSSVLDGFKYHPYVFMLRQSPGGKDSVEPFAHQVELLYRLFPRKPLKALIGDEIGLGKTIEAIMLLRYLQEVGEAKKALVLIPRVLVSQWESELRRFGIGPRRIERDTIQILEAMKFPDGVYLASIDLVKREDYRPKVLEVKWDLVIVDEAHRVGIVGSKKNLRYVFLEELISRYPSLNLIMLSATPHRGKVEDYIQRLKLVDPNLYAGVNELDNEVFYKHVNEAMVFRRTKLEVNEVYEKSDVFKPCEFIAYVVEASEEEKKFHNTLIRFLRNKLLDYYSKVGKEPRGLGLLLTFIAKRASSSPVAAMKTIHRILARRSAKIRRDPEEILKELERSVDEYIDAFFTSFEEYGEIFDELEKNVTDLDDVFFEDLAEYFEPLLDERDAEELKALLDLAGAVKSKDRRLAEVLSLVKTHLQRGDKIVIFTEFKDTAEYVYESLLKELPSPARDKVCLVTASKIEPPRTLGVSSRSRRHNIEDVKNWLNKNLVDVVVSTDVASEGLNLQYANVVIHYEPTWSPIKIVQRIGRVWRVGQVKSVYSYNVLLTVESDLAVFENLYGKLLSWLIAGVESKVLLGEKLSISFLKTEKASDIGVDIFAMPISAGMEEEGYSEYRAILEFIRDGRQGLERYINQILLMLDQLRRLSKKAGGKRGDKLVAIESALTDGLSGLCRKPAKEALLNLLDKLASAEDCKTKKNEDGSIFIDCQRLGVATSIESIADAFKLIETLIGERDKIRKSKTSEPIILLAASPRGVEAPELHLFAVEARVHDRIMYSEVIGILGNEQPIRGSRLIDVLAEVITNVIGIANSIAFSDVEVFNRLATKAKSILSRALRLHVASPLESYIQFVDGKGLSHKHVDWEPSTKSIVLNVRWIGSVLFARTDVSERAAPPPKLIKEVEKLAMEFIMKFEKEVCHREPIDVHEEEHYDIRSYDPKTGEVRYIEVKGRWGPSLNIEISDTELECARRLGKDHWLYIVYDIGSGRPKLVMIRDPANNVIWKPIVDKYRLAGFKYDASEGD